MSDTNIVSIKKARTISISAKEIIGICGSAIDMVLGIAMSYHLAGKSVIVYNADNNRVLNMCRKSKTLDGYGVKIADLTDNNEICDIALVVGNYEQPAMYNICTSVLFAYDADMLDLSKLECDVKELCIGCIDYTITYRCPYGSASSLYRYCIEEQLSGYVASVDAVKFFDQTENDAFLIYQLKNFGKYDLRKFSSVYISNIVGLCGSLSSICSADEVHNSVLAELLG